MNKKILIVDEHPDTRNIVSRWLIRTGYEVVAASTFREGLSHCGVDHFDLLIGDLTSTDISRYDLLRELAKHCRIKGLAYLGSNHETDVQLARDAGFDAYLLKPIDFLVLTDRVATMLDGDEMESAVLSPGDSDGSIRASA